ncbi:hypothetical protein [Leisingera sp. ANG-M7]|uniref:hypothetical protein n=1 Tax=Leisingera sp. ANG-M7 TaxID=1577902 RepID=UPI00057D39CE|nr:hypothetical protein [Leisingera sp. ANG-M7]KIC35443.1 hypothetical protein RA26_16910 [Leisingera sp. ANG-M7]
MSDPVTHAEIEDVLSSIRRLVSEDTREQPAAPEPAARLVLTPALRVQESATRNDLPSDHAAEPAEQPETQSQAEPRQTASGAAADAGTAAEDADSLLIEEPPLAFRHHRELSRSRRNAAAADPSETEQADTDQANPDAPWGNPENTLFAAAAGAGRHGGAAAGEAEIEAADPAPVLLKDGGLAGGTAGARAASVVRKIAEMEARGSAAQASTQQASIQQAGTQHDWEPDSQTEAPFAGADTIEWRDEPLPLRREQDPEEEILDVPASCFEPESVTAPDNPEAALNPDTAAASAEAAVEDAVTGAAMDTLADEGGDSYLDEDALRDLVASIVREELQGPLGERITRNVRKLVRREIQRALAAHDLL